MNSTKHRSCLDVQLVPPPGELSLNKMSRLILAHCPPWHENTTSSTKPEVHNVSQRCRRTIEPRPQAASIKLVTFGRVVFEFCERTNKQTNRHNVGLLMTILRTPSWDEVKTTITAAVKTRRRSESSYCKCEKCNEFYLRPQNVATVRIFSHAAR